MDKRQQKKTEPAAEVRDLRKIYAGRNGSAVAALRGVSLRVGRGEIFGIIGENGAGKTTLVECMTGSRLPDEGAVSLLGTDPGRAVRSEKRRLFNRIGVQFQHTNFRNKIRVREACECAAALYSNPADWKKLLETFRLGAKEHSSVAELSGGQRQKLSVILALIPAPEILFLDELTTGLDPRARREMWDYLKALKEDGMTIIMTSHFMDEVEYLCGTIAILKNGLITAEGTPAELMEQHSTKTLEEAFLLYMDKDEEAEYCGEIK